MPTDEPKTSGEGHEGGVADALRAAVERTLAATAPRAVETRERAGELVSEISKRGQEARGELARRGQEAGAEIARLGQEARDALARRGVETTGEVRSRLDALEQRLVAVEERLKSAQGGAGRDLGVGGTESKPQAES